MICGDTNVFVNFLRGAQSEAVEKLQKALDDKQLLLSPFVLAELLSSPKLPQKTELALLALPRIEIGSNFFEASGFLRRQIYQAGGGVSIADVFIAQSCIEARVPLLTDDRDFLLISQHSELKVIGPFVGRSPRP